MSTTPKLFEELRKRGVELRLIDGELRYSAGEGGLAGADAELLRARRAEIVTYLQARKAAERPGIRKSSAPPLPSFPQEMWWHWIKGASTINQNIHFTSVFEDVDESSIRSALRQLIIRHDVLRSSFHEESDRLVVALNPPDSFRVEMEDLQHLDYGDALALARARAAEFCAPPIHMDGQWVFQCKGFRLPSRAALVAVAFNHIIADAASCLILYQDLKTLLQGGISHEDSARLQFYDYASCERDWIGGPGGDILIDYWKQWNAAQPTLISPEGKTLLEWKPGERVGCQFSLDAHVREKIRELSKAISASEYLTCLTMFSIAIARWSGQDIFAVRSIGDTRTTLELLPMVGFLFCADAISVSVPSGKDFVTVLRSIEAEYNATIQRRLPTIPMVAPHFAYPGIDDPSLPNRIAITMNFIPFRGALSNDQKQAEGAEAMTWPPATEYFTPVDWPVRIPPIALQLSDTGTTAVGRLQFNAALLTARERESFLSALFAVLAETLQLN